MAKCPACGVVLDWWKIVQLDRASLLSCTRCGALLAHNRRRMSELTAILVIILFLPATGWLPWGWDLWWIVTAFAIFVPILVRFAKLDIIGAEELQVTAKQEENWADYAAGRRRLNRIATAMILSGFGLFAGDAFSARLNLPEWAAVLCLSVAMLGAAILVLTRCPFCRKMTLRIPGGDGSRCMNCHRDIDVRQD